MTPQTLALVSIPIFIGGLAFTIYNFVRASKMVKNLDIGGFSSRVVYHLIGGIVTTIGGFGSVISLIWYILLTFK